MCVAQRPTCAGDERGPLALVVSETAARRLLRWTALRLVPRLGPPCWKGNVPPDSNPTVLLKPQRTW